MKRAWIGLFVAATFSGEATAAKMPEEDLSMFKVGCVAGISITRHETSMKPSQFDGKYAPKNEKKLPAYCECVLKRYWAGAPQSVYDAAVAEIKHDTSPVEEASDDDDDVDPTMEAAKKACRA